MAEDKPEHWRETARRSRRAADSCALIVIGWVALIAVIAYTVSWLT